MDIQELQSDIIDKMMEKLDREMQDFFLPYFRQAGIKGEITKGKVRWRGIKMIVKGDNLKTSYQLIQRGELISPKFVVDMQSKICQN